CSLAQRAVSASDARPARSVPYLAGSAGYDAELPRLGCLAEQVPLRGGGEAALGRDRELAEVRELRGRADPRDDPGHVLHLVVLGGDKAEHRDLSCGQVPERLE